MSTVLLLLLFFHKSMCGLVRAKDKFSTRNAIFKQSQQMHVVGLTSMTSVRRHFHAGMYQRHCAHHDI